MRNKIIVQLAVNFIRERNKIVADCPAICLATSGRTVEQAKRSFNEAFELWLETALERRMLADVLRKLGWRIRHGEVQIPGKVCKYESVPVHLVCQGYRSLALPVSVQ